MNMEWPCKRCGRKFGADSRQFRIGYSKAPAVQARIEYIECRDPKCRRCDRVKGIGSSKYPLDTRAHARVVGDGSATGSVSCGTHLVL